MTHDILLHIIQTDLAPEIAQEAISKLEMIDQVREETREKIAQCQSTGRITEAAKLVYDLFRFEATVLDYYRLIFREIAAATPKS